MALPRSEAIPAGNHLNSSETEITPSTTFQLNTPYDASSQQNLNSPDMGSEASIESFESQGPVSFHFRDGYVSRSEKAKKSAESERSKLKASASTFRPRVSIPTMNGGHNTSAPISTLPTLVEGQASPFLTGAIGYPRTHSPFGDQLFPLNHGFQQQPQHSFHTPQMPLQGEFNQQPFMNLTGSRPYGQMPHTPGQNFGQEAMNMDHTQTAALMALLNSSHHQRTPYGSFQPAQGFLTPQKNQFYHGMAGNIPYHPSVASGQMAMPKMHGGSPINERHKMISRQNVSDELNRNFRFPMPKVPDELNRNFRFPMPNVPDELNRNFQFPMPSTQGESSGPFGVGLGTQPGQGDEIALVNNNSLGVPLQYQLPPHLQQSIAANGSTPSRKGHNRHKTAIRVSQQAQYTDQASLTTPKTPHGMEIMKHPQYDETPTKFYKGVPFGPTPSPSFEKDLSRSVVPRGFKMTGNSVPRRARRRTMDVRGQHGAPPFFDQDIEDQDLDFPVTPTQPLPRRTPNTNLALVPVGSPSDKSKPFKQLISTFTRDGNPTFNSAMENLPLCDQLESGFRHSGHAVLRISNIPFAVKRSEILGFLKSARLVPESEGEAIHIMMDPLTGKTMEAYAEFVSTDAALSCAQRYLTNRSGGRGGKLGERYVEVESVGPEVLMRDLFPKAKHVTWDGFQPTITMADPDNPLDTPFTAFITAEELNSLYRHIQQPNRSPFSRDCPQRPYECLISIMLKYPWHMTNYIKLKDRSHLYHIVLDSIFHLKEVIAADVGKADLCLDSRLLGNICRAVRQCKGFTVAQKYEIHRVAGVEAHWVPHPDDWIWQALGPVSSPIDNSDILEYYMALINKLSSKGLDLQQRRRLSEDLKKPISERQFNDSVWGPIKIDYPQNPGELTMSQIATLEWDAISKCLRGLQPLE